MRIHFLTLILCMFLIGCTQRQVIEGEILLSEVIYEENGYYYQLSAPNTKVKYTGDCTFYHHENGQKKGMVTLLDGLPHGVWQYWDVEGNFKYALYFDNGSLLERKDAVD